METNKPQAQANLKEEATEIRSKISKRTIISILAVVLGIALFVIIFFIVRANGAKKADEAVALADIEQNDSIRLELYKKAAELGYASGNRAKLDVAIILYQQGVTTNDSTKFEEAIKYLDDASIDSKLVDAGRLSLMGDCYVNLHQLDKALTCYEKAIKASDSNPQVIPFVLVKEANIYREQKKYEDEYKAYNKIFTDYPEYAQMLNFDIRKYAELAKVNAGK